MVRREIPRTWIGWANALAAGLMLGIAYVLGEVGLGRLIPAATAGSLLGIAFVYLTHRLDGLEGVTPNQTERGPSSISRGLLVQSLHSASEGVAIGAASAVSLGLGIFTVVALAAHNVPEGAVLCSILGKRKYRLGEAAALAISTNLGQVIMAVVTFVATVLFPFLLPWSLGFAAGALLYLVMVELLPDSYREAGQMSIALVTSISMGLVVLLNSSFVR